MWENLKCVHPQYETPVNPSLVRVLSHDHIQLFEGFLFFFCLIVLVFQNGADDVKKHRWFKTVDWDAVPLRKLKVGGARNPLK